MSHYVEVEDPKLVRERNNRMAEAQGASRAIQAVRDRLGGSASEAAFLVGGAPSGIDFAITGSISSALNSLNEALAAANAAYSEAYHMKVCRLERIDD